MTVIDSVILVLVVGGVVYGFTRGIIGEISTSVGVVLGILVCLIMGDKAVEALRGMCSGWQKWPMAAETSSAIALGVLFIVVFLACRIVGKFLKGITHTLMLGPIDRLLGAVVGAAVMLLAMSFVLNIYFVSKPDAKLFTPERLESDKPLFITLNTVPWLLGSKTDVADALPAYTDSIHSLYNAGNLKP